MLDVLFVCTGNICRSPLAEAFLLERCRRLPGGGVRVRSAGTWGRAGHPAMPETIAVAAERGIDLEEHAATPLTPDQIEEADLVLGLTQEHRDEVVRMVPFARAKTFTLKELATLLRMLDVVPTVLDREAALARIAEADDLRTSAEGPMILDLDVTDPLGFGPDFHRAIAWEIEEAVDVLVSRLFGPAARARAAGE